MISLPLPRFNALNKEGALALLDWMDAHIPDTVPADDLDQLLPHVPGVTGDDFCQCGCHEHMRQAEKERVQVTVDGKRLDLTPEQRRLIWSWTEETQHE